MLTEGHIDQPTIDEQLEVLLPTITEAVRSSGTVVAQLLWQSCSFLPLLPFQLHLRWPDHIPELSLTSSFTLFPCGGHARRLFEQPYWDAAEARTARQAARSARYSEKRSRTNDFESADWESAIHRHRLALAGRRLPASSFISVDVVDSRGAIAQGRRPVLGQYATRRALRPQLVICGRTPTDKTWERLAAVDVALFDLQSLRGLRSRESARAILIARGDQRPTLIVASTPSEVRPLSDLLNGVPIRAVGAIPHLNSVKTEIVCLDRPLAEAELPKVLYSLRDLSSQTESVIEAATHAWWSAWQSMTDNPEQELAIQRYLSAVQELRERDRFLADQFNAFTVSLRNVTGDPQRSMGRLEALRRQLELRGWPAVKNPITVLVKHGGAHVALSHYLNECWPDTDLSAIGIRTIREPADLTDLSVIVSGYYGERTLDWVLRSGAKEALFVIDPVESQYLAVACRHAREWLNRASVELPILTKIIELLAGIAPVGSINFDFGLSVLGEERSERTDPLVLTSARDAVFIRFSDGDGIVVERTRRFDVINSAAGSVEPRPASELEPGNEIVVLEEASQQTYSEHLQQELDRGPLLDLWLQRQRWIARVAEAMRFWSLDGLHKALLERGIQITYTAVRTWVRPNEEYEAVVPLRFNHFTVLSELLELEYSDEELRTIFRAIRLLRIEHRRRCRQLVQVMRTLAAGRLGRASLLQVEQMWGFDVRKLLAATRLAMVDEVTPA